MSHATNDLADRLLADVANAETPPSKPSMYGYRSLAKRLSEHCPKAPIAMPAFRRYLDDTGKATLKTVRRRYDFANRVFNSEPVKVLGIPNPCDLIARPGKIVTSSLRQRREYARANGPTPPPPPAPAPGAETPPPLVTVPDIIIPDSMIPTREVVDRYLERARQRGLKARTLVCYGYVLDALAEVSPTLPMSVVEDIYVVLGDPGYYKGNTRRQRYGVLSAFVHSLVYQALGIENTLSQVPRPPKEKTRKRKFTDAEIAALLEVGTPQEVAFVRLCLDCGIRVGEAASLTVDSIEYDELSVDGKSGVHKVPVHPSIAEEMLALANERGEIWWDERGKLNGAQLAKRFRQHAERVGISGEQIGAHTVVKMVDFSYKPSSAIPADAV